MYNTFYEKCQIKKIIYTGDACSPTKYMASTCHIKGVGLGYGT